MSLREQFVSHTDTHNQAQAKAGFRRKGCVKETKSILSFNNKSKRKQAVPKNEPTENSIYRNMTDKGTSVEQTSMCKYLG